MIDKKHVMQTMDWSKYDLPGWLEQFGAWQATAQRNQKTKNPIAVAMKEAKLKLKKKDIAKLMAYYFCDESIEEVRGKNKILCEITDDEARAVQRLILDVINNTDSEALLGWMDVIICRYFERHSWSKLQTPERTVMEAKYDIRCGLAVLHYRYPFIKYNKGHI